MSTACTHARRFWYRSPILLVAGPDGIRHPRADVVERCQDCHANARGVGIVCSPLEPEEAGLPLSALDTDPWAWADGACQHQSRVLERSGAHVGEYCRFCCANTRGAGRWVPHAEVVRFRKLDPASLPLRAANDVPINQLGLFAEVKK